MPVKKTGKKRRGVLGCILVCDQCGQTSPVYYGDSPAAPELTACEKAEKDGWAYDIGFFSMLMGHTVVCPGCVKGN